MFELMVMIQTPRLAPQWRFKVSDIILSLIVAMDENRVIGNKNKIPWNLPADLRHFRRITMDTVVIMGRKTFESIGKPLDGRQNVIITRDESFQAPQGCVVVHSVEDALAFADSESAKSYDVMVIGGEEIYRQFLPLVEIMHITFVHDSFEGDSYFPEYEASEWKEDFREEHQPDENNPYSYTFCTLYRI